MKTLNSKASPRLAGRVLHVAVLLLSMAGAAQAQLSLSWRELLWNDAFARFDSATYTLSGSAIYDALAGNIRLTPAASGQAGRIYLKAPRAASAFDVEFTAHFGVSTPQNNGGADGIVLATATVIDAAPSYGGLLDFEGSNGYGYEFDTYSNSQQTDPNDQHIGVIQNSAGNHLHYETMAPNELEDGGWHRIRVSNTGGFVKMYIDGTDRFTYTIPNYQSVPVHFGFTSATGFAFNEHRIDNVSVSVPSRLRADLGSFSACDTVRLDRVVRVTNNHPSRLPLSVTGIGITELDRVGEFSIVSNPAPLSIPFGDSIAVTVRFIGTGAGTHRGLLSMTASNGETIEDTLVLIFAMPQADVAPPTITFPRTHVGASGELRAMLRNTGVVPMTIRGITATPADFSVTKPTAFPVTLQPGDTLETITRFTPRTEGWVTGQLRFDAGCGPAFSAALAGEGWISTFRVEFLREALMLLPGKEGQHFVMFVNSQGAGMVKGIDARLSYDSSVARLVSVSLIGSRWQSSAQLSSDISTPGLIRVSIRDSVALPSAGGLFTLTFRAARADTGCTALRWDSLLVNPQGPFPDIPRGRAATGGICINPSCRVPEGMIGLEQIFMSARPNPFNPSTTLSWFLPEAGLARIDVYDASGRIVATPFSGPAASGTHSTRLDAPDLPSGVYHAVLSVNTQGEQPRTQGAARQAVTRLVLLR
ncbi:MAG: choice-of-anchor D domain-containing protein [Ignavibacteria bacterium]|nr:choice-of-anchor D domain-containing protein [Ignavibacteria bacterium]